ncbi:MAG TPA: hypothetical protein VFA33_23185 [Bryobacteraceae bacterium]|nr:hypothetical protein [Bryobacteraceae bacterium]
MHAYSTDSADRRWAPLVLAGASIALTYVCSRLLAAFNLAWPWWIENPSILLFYGAFWSLYDRILWRQQLLRIRLSQLPDLGGTWRVRLQSCHDGGTRTEGCIRIHQTATEILIEFENETSRSVSRMAAINVQPGSSQGLMYEYANDPSFPALQSMHGHRGVAMLRWAADGRTLDGEYFTGRDRQTHGSISICRIDRRHLDWNTVRTMCREGMKEHD